MTTQADTKKTYVLDGTLLEACSCGGPCPCWVGDDPDGGRCDSVNAYHIDRGRVGGVDVSNLSFVQVNQIPGNVLAGPIEHRVEGGKGTLRVGEVVEAEMTPYTDADGRPTTIHDTVFSTIPVSPAYLAKASRHRVNIPEYGMIWEFSGRNAIQGDFHFEA
jgi:hypothetical protein